ncbi:MAG: phage terminase large subunit [Candidatus Omnitrophica bacterium]|nr:phage terminase large subunit [Candidatus Omnitrophota bacterium]
MRKTTNKLKLLRKELGRNSILDFAKIYFPQYMTSSSPSFHGDICKSLMDISEKRNGRLAVAAPRGHAKSTVASLFYVLWSICYNKEKFILILSATAKQAQTLLADITRALETNTRLLEDFSDIFSDNLDVKTKWTQHEIITKNGIKVTALGREQDMRGLRHQEDRPTLIILDDIDSEKNTYNADSREKLFNLFTKTILKAGALKGAVKECNVVTVGTLLHPDSLLSRLIKQEQFPDWNKMFYKAVINFSEHKDLWQTWSNILFGRGELYEEEYGLKAADKFFEVHKQEMLEGTKVLWPEIEDYYQLMKIREIEGAYAFDSEKQNNPTSSGDSRYDPDNFTYWDKDYADAEQLIASFGDDYSIIGACDPSVGMANNRADYSAIIILAKHKGHLYVLDADIKQRSQDDLVQSIINFCDIYRHMEKFVIEANLFPELLVKYVRERAEQENVIAPLKETRNTRNKELRIFGMETYITKGIILFSRSQQILLDQLKYFPRDTHDDGPDALEMALREAEKDGIGFVDLGKKRDRHGRTEDDPDFNRTTPEEDAQDADDDDNGNPFVVLS